MPPGIPPGLQVTPESGRLEAVDEGPLYTRGHTYRARAEARQRAYRAELGARHGTYGHFLAKEAADEGKNFILDETFRAARQRERAGKGVTARTFENMLSSQAMCFNVFAPLASRLELATAVFQPFIPGLVEVTAIRIEHTPSRDIFRDQSGTGGVDCDLLIEARTDRGTLLQVVETKFVETEFSVCGFRKAGRARKGLSVCAEDVGVRDDRRACLYVRNKGYGYWERTDEHRVLALDAVEQRGCPFGGPRWQLWVNLVLAHVEGMRRDADDARFAVCTSPRNTALLGGGEVLEGFKSLLAAPDTVSLVDLDALLKHVETCVPEDLAGWAGSLRARYADI